MYLLYKLKYTEEVSDDIMKDCPRCNFNKCHEFKRDPRTLKNPLFNVLNAYAHYDPEVSYGQGMNYVTANILAYMQLTQRRDESLFPVDQKQYSLTQDESWPFDEVDAFYMLVYIMEDIGWRELIRPGLPGLKVMHDALKQYVS